MVLDCGSCGHRQLHPPYYTLEHYHQDDQVNFVVHDYGTPMERIIEHSWIDAKKRVLRFADKGVELKSIEHPKIIDIGGGYGFFGSEMMKYLPGSEMIVLEPSGVRIEKGKHYLQEQGNPVPTFIQGLLDEEFVKSNSGKYDIVTIWHVLEHVPNPSELLVNAVRLAKHETGMVFVECPNAEDELIQLSSAFRDRSFMIEHISYFDKRTFERLAFLSAPNSTCNVYGYQRYGIFNYMNWIYKNEPLGNNPDMLECEGRWWLEKNWKINREASFTSDTLFMVIKLGI
jgi:2-polyprenyl-3-methyl-5-hydroxy-6-metoxy-1,4-benzoquinol methylase